MAFEDVGMKKKCPWVTFQFLFLIQVVEAKKESKHPETMAQVSDSPILITGFHEKTDSTAPQKPKARTDSEPQGKPVEQDSEKNTLISQQLGDTTDSLPVPAACTAARQSQAPGSTQKHSSCDGEEKRDQSKEETSLEKKQLEGELRCFLGRRHIAHLH